MVDLKTFLSLATPNQSCLSVTKLILSWFWGDILGPEVSNFHDPYNTLLLYCMMIHIDCHFTCVATELQRGVCLVQSLT